MLPAESTKHALRLTFEYNGSQLKKLSQQRIERISPPSHPTESAGQVGFWYELRDPNDKVLYRRVIHNPMQVDAETPTLEGTFARRPRQSFQGIFQIVVPELSQAPILVFFATPQPAVPPVGSPDQEAARSPVPRVGIEAAREIARFNLQGGNQ